MFCSQCGANNADNAATCMQCGRTLQATQAPVAFQPTGVVLPPGQTVPNYLVFAILSTVCCCPPAGIVGIVYAAQVNNKVATGNIAGALADSKNAKLWSMISVGVGLAGVILYGVLIMLGVVSGIANSH